jgi:hypothetical protein
MEIIYNNIQVVRRLEGHDRIMIVFKRDAHLAHQIIKITV